ncbi:MAG: transposase [Paludibacteraceae bacterium]|nr:transposase [Paludibacteraceae bacterium]
MSENTGNSEHDKFLGKYRKQSARAMWHDYDGGLYFVTICTKDRQCYFGNISDSRMCFTEIGEYAEQCIKQISAHNQYAEILSWVIMPNHIHLMIKISQFVET